LVLYLFGVVGIFDDCGVVFGDDDVVGVIELFEVDLVELEF